MYVIIPTFLKLNNPLKRPRFYKTASGIKNYANKHNILLEEVKDLKDINKLLRSHHIDYVDIDHVFIGW